MYRRASSGNFVKIKTIMSGDTVSYVDSYPEAKNSYTYYYAVKGFTDRKVSSGYTSRKL